MNHACPDCGADLCWRFLKTEVARNDAGLELSRPVCPECHAPLFFNRGLPLQARVLLVSLFIGATLVMLTVLWRYGVLAALTVPLLALGLWWWYAARSGIRDWPVYVQEPFSSHEKKGVGLGR